VRQVYAQKGLNKFVIDNLGRLSSGQYLVKIATEEGATYNKLQVK
jgi:hypothetical protein